MEIKEKIRRVLDEHYRLNLFSSQDRAFLSRTISELLNDDKVGTTISTEKVEEKPKAVKTKPKTSKKNKKPDVIGDSIKKSVKSKKRTKKSIR
tara:strand:- start:22065 stop:22343 length:279 start_codon:yes stop_codon:yes gene_type:complete